MSKYIKRLTELALRLFFADKPLEVPEQLRVSLLELITKASARLDNNKRQEIINLVNKVPEEELARWKPPSLVLWLFDEFGLEGLTSWACDQHPQLSDQLGAETLRQLIRKVLDDQTEEFRAKLLEAGIRYWVGLRRDSDLELIENVLGRNLIEKEEKNMATFIFDESGLPKGFSDAKKTAFENAVKTELKDSFGVEDDKVVVHAAVIGMLLLDEYFDPQAYGFSNAIQKAWIELLAKTTDANGTSIPNQRIYEEIMDLIPAVPSHGSEIFYQEFASVGRYVIARTDDVPLGHANFSTQVRLGVDNYVAGAPPFDSLELPPLVGEDGDDVEIEPDNIRSVALIYAAYQLEQLRLFHVMDRMTEIFMNGMLPVGFDNGGKALNTYYWDSEDRMTEAARYMQYSRVLGVPGGDVSKEVQPNSEFNSLWLRFLSSLVEYDRQQRIGDLFDGRQRPLSLTGEQVRKAGRDLAANVSLYGWGYTHFAARHLNSHITEAITILKLPQIQKAYGVSNPWQVVERVAAMEFGQAPNIVRYRTMAQAGKKILDLVAKHYQVWSGSSGKPLFTDNTLHYMATTTNVPLIADIPLEDQGELMRQTQYWLAVNGIKDEQVDQYSQPEESTIAPSIPAFGGSKVNGNGHLEQLKQMVSAGQTPSLDQLRELLPNV